MCPVSIFPQTMRAEVAQHGQRRRTEAPIPQGFVGSNPTLRTQASFLYGFAFFLKYLYTKKLTKISDGTKILQETMATSMLLLRGSIKRWVPKNAPTMIALAMLVILKAFLSHSVMGLSLIFVSANLIFLGLGKDGSLGSQPLTRFAKYSFTVISRYP